MERHGARTCLIFAFLLICVHAKEAATGEAQPSSATAALPSKHADCQANSTTPGCCGVAMCPFHNGVCCGKGESCCPVGTACVPAPAGSKDTLPQCHVARYGDFSDSDDPNAGLPQIMDLAQRLAAARGVAGDVLETDRVPLCQQPVLVGPCKAALQRWYWDPSNRACKQFVYGGCQGNDNNFESKDLCESTCVRAPVIDTSAKAKDTSTSVPNGAGMKITVVNDVPGSTRQEKLTAAHRSRGRVGYSELLDRPADIYQLLHLRDPHDHFRSAQDEFLLKGYAKAAKLLMSTAEGYNSSHPCKCPEPPPCTEFPCLHPPCICDFIRQLHEIVKPPAVIHKHADNNTAAPVVSAPQKHNDTNATLSAEEKKKLCFRSIEPNSAKTDHCHAVAPEDVNAPNPLDYHIPSQKKEDWEMKVHEKYPRNHGAIDADDDDKVDDDNGMDDGTEDKFHRDVEARISARKWGRTGKGDIMKGVHKDSELPPLEGPLGFESKESKGYIELRIKELKKMIESKEKIIKEAGTSYGFDPSELKEEVERLKKNLSAKEEELKHPKEHEDEKSDHAHHKKAGHKKHDKKHANKHHGKHHGKHHSKHHKHSGSKHHSKPHKKTDTKHHNKHHSKHHTGQHKGHKKHGKHHYHKHSLLEVDSALETEPTVSDPADAREGKFIKQGRMNLDKLDRGLYRQARPNMWKMPICVAKSRNDLMRTLLFANERDCGRNRTDLFTPYLSFSAYAEPMKNTVAYCVRSSKNMWRTEIVPSARSCSKNGWNEEFMFFAFPTLPNKNVTGITGLAPYCVRESISNTLAKRQYISPGTSCTNKYWAMKFVFYAFPGTVPPLFNLTNATAVANKTLTVNTTTTKKFFFRERLMTDETAEGLRSNTAITSEKPTVTIGHPNQVTPIRDTQKAPVSTRGMPRLAEVHRRTAAAQAKPYRSDEDTWNSEISAIDASASVAKGDAALDEAAQW